MDKQTFCSSQAASNVSRYAAAVYRKGDFVLLPLTSVKREFLG